MTGSEGVDLQSVPEWSRSKVQAKWFEVWPRAANAGPERRVVIQAGAGRDGTVLKLVIASRQVAKHCTDIRVSPCCQAFEDGFLKQCDAPVEIEHVGTLRKLRR